MYDEFSITKATYDVQSIANIYVTSQLKKWKLMDLKLLNEM